MKTQQIKKWFINDHKLHNVIIIILHLQYTHEKTLISKCDDGRKMSSPSYAPFHIQMPIRCNIYDISSHRVQPSQCAQL